MCVGLSGRDRSLGPTSNRYFLMNVTCPVSDIWAYLGGNKVYTACPVSQSLSAAHRHQTDSAVERRVSINQSNRSGGRMGPQNSEAV